MDSKSGLQEVSLQDLIGQVSEGFKDRSSRSRRKHDASNMEAWNELSTLLRDLDSLISREESISRHIEIYRRIFQLDDIVHALSKYRRALLQIILGHTLRALASLQEAQEALSEAVSCFNQALTELSPKRQPGIWAQTQAAQGVTLEELSRMQDTPVKRQMRLTAIRCFDSACTIYTPQEAPHKWAELQRHKGGIWFALSLSYTPFEKVKALRAAAECFDKQMMVFTSQSYPKEWAKANHNKGSVLFELGRMLLGGERVQTFRTVLKCLDSALTVYTLKENADDWADVQFKRGLTLYNIGGSLGELQGVIGATYAVDCYNEALKVYTGEHEPQNRALIQYFKGQALVSVAEGGERGERVISGLWEAVACFDDALSVYVHEQDPGMWAELQDWKGTALGLLAKGDDKDNWYGEISAPGSALTHQERLSLFRAAIECFNATLSVRTRENNPVAWAMSQNNKGGTLFKMSELLDDAERLDALKEAIDCLDKAQTEQQYMKDNTWWARTDQNRELVLGNLLELQKQTNLSSADSQVLELSPYTKAELVRKLDFHQLGLTGKPSPSYFELQGFVKVRSMLHNIIDGSDDKHTGLLILGEPKSGKTHLALEVLRLEAADFFLIFWPPSFLAPPPSSLNLLRDQRIVLFLENLIQNVQLFGDTAKDEIAIILQVINRLKIMCKQVIIVATATVSTDIMLTAQGWDKLFELLAQVTIKPAVLTKSGIDEILNVIDLVGRVSDRRDLGQEPNSVTEVLERRRSQLQNPSFPSDALAILKSLRLLRSIGIFVYPEERVRRVACGVFGLAMEPNDWSMALKRLMGDGWIRRERGLNEEQEILCVHLDDYLDFCVASIYPETGRRFEDDFAILLKSLGNSPCDAEALFALSQTLEESLETLSSDDQATKREMIFECLRLGLAATDSTQQPYLWAQMHKSLGDNVQFLENPEVALEEYNTALTVFTRESFPEEWAESQIALGRVYVSNNMNIDAALAAFNVSLTVFTREEFPQQWEMVQWIICAAYEKWLLIVALASFEITDMPSDHCRSAISSFESVLSISTYEDSPKKWAMLKMFSGIAYAALIERDENIKLSDAIESLNAALTVLTRESFPTEWALLQLFLCDLLFKEETQVEFDASVQKAIAMLRDVLSVCTPDSLQLIWAKTQLLLGRAYFVLDEGEADESKNIEEAIAFFNAALKVYTREFFPLPWAMIKAFLALCFRDRELGEPHANLEASVATYEEALSVITVQVNPDYWAKLTYMMSQTQISLAMDNAHRNKGVCLKWISAAIDSLHSLLQIDGLGELIGESDAYELVRNLEAWYENLSKE